MRLSIHAVTRSRQRGIPLQYLPLILEYGTPVVRPGNATEYQLLDKDLKKLLQILEKLAGRVVIVGQDDTVITTYLKKSQKSRRSQYID
jgi:hypothetical protein